MAVMKIFEIHVYRGGNWTIDSIFDDLDLALCEAERMDRGGRFSAVRVVEETFDEQTEKSRTRTVFRSTKADKINAATKARVEAPLRTVAPPRRPPPRRKSSLSSQVIMAILLLSLIVAGGLGAIYLINTANGFG